LALYYYTNGRPSSEINHGLEDHSTLFVDRKGSDVDAEMRKFNAAQSGRPETGMSKVAVAAKNFAGDLIPPILLKLGRKILK
jgi:hypothetical protein